MTAPRIVDHDHAARVGVVAGLMVRAGLAVDFTFGPDQELLPTLALIMDDITHTGGLRIELVVQP